MRCPVCDKEYGHMPGCPEDIPLCKGYCITYKETVIKECRTFGKNEEDAIQKFHDGKIYDVNIIDEEAQIECVERTN